MRRQSVDADLEKGSASPPPTRPPISWFWRHTANGDVARDGVFHDENKDGIPPPPPAFVGSSGRAGSVPAPTAITPVRSLTSTPHIPHFRSRRSRTDESIAHTHTLWQQLRTKNITAHWSRFKQQLGTSAFSDSFVEDIADAYRTEQEKVVKTKRVRYKTTITPSEQLGNQVPPEEATIGDAYFDEDGDHCHDDGGSDDSDEEDEEEEDEDENENAEVDEVVVDNALGEKTASMAPSEAGLPVPGPGTQTGAATPRPTLGGMSYPLSLSTANLEGLEDFLRPQRTMLQRFSASPFWIFIRWRVWPAVISFFTLRFFEEGTEMHYRRETWFTSKSLGLYSSLFFIVNWIIEVTLGTMPYSLADKIFYFGCAPLFCLPLPWLVIFDIPRHRPRLYQSYVITSVWSWSLYDTVYMYMCGYYGHPRPYTCDKRDFIGTAYYSVALAAVSMFGLRQSRLANSIGALAFVVTNCVLIAPYHFQWVRNVLNVVVFHCFLIYIHYKREAAERRLFSLRDQLKIQFRATQKAQVNERRAADSKRRLTSYVFHEVRVPLNTALLAVQNLEATGTIAKEQDIEWAALEGSLSMMSKVLNDVLDFNRLDSGRFATVNQPYNLHQAIQSMLVPLRLAADARGLNLQIELDRRIDEVARRAAYVSQGRAEGWIDNALQGHPDEEGFVVGDEMRLRQIVTNLASNACKFTPTGGHIKVVTKLVAPVSYTSRNPFRMETPFTPTTGETTYFDRTATDPESTLAATSEPALTGLYASSLCRHDTLCGKASPMAPLSQIVVRIEVHDTGVGIKKKDLIDHKLFSPYVQTEIGKYQGGKGTGLGLALVRRIVKLSGGRLGVKSKLGEGSQFWVELPLGVGEAAVAGSLVPVEGGAGGLGPENALVLEKLALLGEQNDQNPILNQPTIRQSPMPTPPAHLDPAFKTIMEQRGLFELSPRRRPSVESIPTLLSVNLNRSLSDHRKQYTSRYGSSRDSTGPHHNEIPVTCTATATPSSENPPTDQKEETNLQSYPAFSAELRTRVKTCPSTPPTPANSLPTHTSSNSTRPSTVMAAADVLPVVPPAALCSPRVQSRPPSPSIPSSLSYTSQSSPLPPPLHPAFSSPIIPTLPQTIRPADSIQIESGLRVLVVDDDGMTRRLMSRMLTRLGCAVDVAENGRVALDKVFAQPTVVGQVDGYDIVFLDNQMPVMSGLDTVAELRRRGRKDLVVGVTGNALLTDQNEYLEAGANRVLTKPVQERSLKMMLLIADDRRKLAREQVEQR